ncbi:MAG: DUF4835 family protein [Proteiniphilum sp.]|nr:DUF4835 family protein [Proteiniphilum sp.]
MYRQEEYTYPKGGARISARLRYCCPAILLLAGIFSLSAQELNAVVKVHSTGIGGINRQLFMSLEEALHTFINGRKWTDVPFHTDGKRTNCSFTLVITEALSSNSFRGELYVQSHRPAENSACVTPMLNLRDPEMEFDYTEHQPLQFDPHFIQGNLTAIIAYYAYLILGLDLDSRSSLGGTSCFRNMELIASGAQSRGWSGWERRNSRNRSAIAAAFNDGTLEEYRQMWFDYHRKESDMPGENGKPEPERIVSSLRLLSALHEKRLATVLIRLFGDAKLEEMVTLLSKADSRERKQSREALLKLYPARSAELDRLK